MDAPTYSSKQVAEMLGLPPKSSAPVLKQDSYSAEEVWALRAELGRYPPSIGRRKQLFLNFKGGTGKTSLSTSYAWRLAELGYNVLLVDLDSQGHATKCLGFEGEDFDKTLLNVLVRKSPLSEVIQKSSLPNLHFVPSNLTMSTVDLALMPMSGREFKLRNALNALMAANDLFVPVLADFLSFHGLKLLFETVQSLEEDLNHVLDHVFIVVNSFNATFKLAKEALEALQTHYPEYLLPTIIRQCTKFAQASSEGRPVFVADPSSKGATDIEALIQNVLPRLRAGSAPGSDTGAQQAS
jgi:chromosome partitioning protein